MRFLVGLVLLGSFLFHLESIEDHYQECDSSLVYYDLKYFPDAARDYSSHSYTDRYIHPWQDIRLSLIDKGAAAKLPYPMQSALALPWTSTYSPAVGFLYGLVTYTDTIYEKFMASGIELNLIIFHISLFLFFEFLVMTGITAWIAATTLLLFAFSISHYSYAFHLGSTVWNISTGCWWLFAFAALRKNKSRDILMSVVSGLLIFFNYLILFYWASYLVLRLFNFKRSRENFSFQLRLAVSQWPFAAALLVALVTFFQPGQGNRGSVESLSQFFYQTYYVILNFVSFYNRSFYLDMVQALAATVLLVIGARWMFEKGRLSSQENIRDIVLFSFLSIAVFFLAVLSKILGYAASRHILYLSPVFFIFIAFGLSQVLSGRATKVVFILVFFLAIPSLLARKSSTYDQTKKITEEDYRGADKIVVEDCSFNLIYKTWPHSPGAEFSNPENFARDQSYLYLSQTTPVEKMLSSWKGILSKKGLGAIVSQSSSIVTNQFFIAYNPIGYPHNRPNNLFSAKVKIVPKK